MHPKRGYGHHLLTATKLSDCNFDIVEPDFDFDIREVVSSKDF